MERILRMVDGVLILVDAAEGPMPQTRFVTRKALALGLQPIVAINKIDRQDAEPLRVHDEVLSLFIDLEATEAQLNAPFLYTSSRAGTATLELEQPGTNLEPLFQSILDTVPAPTGDPELPFQMLVSTLDFSNFLGRIAIGRIERGRVAAGDQVALLPMGEPGHGSPDEQGVERGRVTKLYTFDGLHRVEVDAGRRRRHRGACRGFETHRNRQDLHRARSSGAARRASRSRSRPSRSTSSSTTRRSPAGKGSTSPRRQLRDRLFKELERNVALRVEETDSPDTHTVAGPRRAAPRHPDGDDAARGVRVPGVAPAGHPRGRRRTASGWSRTRS